MFTVAKEVANYCVIPESDQFDFCSHKRTLKYSVVVYLATCFQKGRDPAILNTHSDTCIQ